MKYNFSLNDMIAVREKGKTKRAVSGILLTLLLVSVFVFAFNVQVVRASGTIYIRADGSIDPLDAPVQRNGDLYILTANITSGIDGIVIEKNDVILDGAGYTVQGSGSGRGIDLTGRSNAKIANATIKNFQYGFWLAGSNYNSISRNNVTYDYWGIWLNLSSDNSMSGNNMAGNFWGIYLKSSLDNGINGNNVTDNNYGISLYYSSNYNSINGNNITDNHAVGIGIGLSSGSSSTNSISGNTIANNVFGIGLSDYSSDNSISGNTIADNDYGISLGSSSNNNSISGNNITANNNYGIVLYSSSNNRFWHNNLDNANQVLAQTGGYTNAWDNGYPSGGNYWSDHACSGNPSSGSQPYIIDADNIDHYPFQDPNGWMRVHNVNTGLNYATIQEAIDAPETLDGHTIFVDAGTYYENVVVNKSVSIIGENRDVTVINGNNKGTVVTVTMTSNVAISNFTIMNATAGIALYESSHELIETNRVEDCWQAIHLESSYNNDIRNNIITSVEVGSDSGVGVIFYGSSNNTIIENLLTLNEWAALWLYSSNSNIISGNNITNNSYGICFGYSSNNSICGNNVTNNTEDGIVIGHSSNNSVVGNDITNNRDGIQLAPSSNNNISGNNITNNNADGIVFGHSSNNSIVGNNITNNGYDGIYFWGSSSNNDIGGNIITNNTGEGILLYSPSDFNSICGNNITANNGNAGIWLLSSDNSISGNTIANSNCGIVLGSSSNNIISENDIANNSYDGIGLYSSSNNTAYHNNFINNGKQVNAAPAGYANIWDGGYPFGGNYWSDYNGTDRSRGPVQNVTGSDGIGDTPFVVGTGNVDHYPLMYPWPRLTGDVNGDGKVLIDDVLLCANAYGSQPGDPRWNPFADVSGDGRVRVDDVLLAALNFGRTRK